MRPVLHPAALAASLAMAAPATAQVSRHQLTCDLGGQTAQMFVEIQVTTRAGIVQNYRGAITGVFDLGDVVVYSSGVVRTPTDEWVFTGENAYAEFYRATGGSFLAEFQVRPPYLVIVIDPFGSRQSVLCQEVR